MQKLTKLCIIAQLFSVDHIYIYLWFYLQSFFTLHFKLEHYTHAHTHTPVAVTYHVCLDYIMKAKVSLSADEV